MGSGQVQSGEEKFYLWLVQAAKNLSRISSKHSVGAHGRGKGAGKAIKYVPECLCLTSPAMWSEQWPDVYGMAKVTAKNTPKTTIKANLPIPGLGAAQDLLNNLMSH